jgi:alpha-N-acetylglucosaminidase
MRKIIFLFLLIIFSSQIQSQNKEAILQLIIRIIPSKASSFTIKYQKVTSGKDFFELYSENNKNALVGNNNVSIASALYYYLKNYTHFDISWNGRNLKLPDQLPLIKQKIVHNTPYQYRYYINYCTNNYSMTWWDWNR